MFKSFSSKLYLTKHIRDDHNEYKKCKECETEFNLPIELEEHIVNEHSGMKNHKCDMCDMQFVFKWRLQKHIEDHQKAVIKTCHFFNNKKDCPYSKSGCKFLHEIALNCKYAEKCYVTKCQFRHD